MKCDVCFEDRPTIETRVVLPIIDFSDRSIHGVIYKNICGHCYDKMAMECSLLIDHLRRVASEI